MSSQTKLVLWLVTKWNSKSSRPVPNLSIALESKTKTTSKQSKKKQLNGRKRILAESSLRKIFCKTSSMSLSRILASTRVDSTMLEKSWDTFHCATRSWSTLIAENSFGSHLMNLSSLCKLEDGTWTSRTATVTKTSKSLRLLEEPRTLTTTSVWMYWNLTQHVRWCPSLCKTTRPTRSRSWPRVPIPSLK